MVVRVPGAGSHPTEATEAEPAGQGLPVLILRSSAQGAFTQSASGRGRMRDDAALSEMRSRLPGVTEAGGTTREQERQTYDDDRALGRRAAVCERNPGASPGYNQPRPLIVPVQATLAGAVNRIMIF